MLELPDRYDCVTIPTPVLVEWWRERGPYRLIKKGALLEPLSESTAREAGRAVSVTRAGPSVVDAAVMASAAQRQDVVYTGDVRDLELLQTAFPTVRVMRL